MTLVQQRQWRLIKALADAAELPVESKHLLVMDRPTESVRRIAETSAVREDTHTVSSPFPVMSPEGGQRWTEVRNWALERIDELWPDTEWVTNWDDDSRTTNGWERLGELLAIPEVCSWRAVTLFLWDQDGNVNVRQRHNSPLFGRHRPGWRRDSRLCDQVAVEVTEEVRKYPEKERYLPFYLLDYGSVDPQERARLYHEYANAGKFDEYTRKYVEEPILKPLHEILEEFPDPRKYWEYQIATAR